LDEALKASVREKGTNSGITGLGGENAVKF